MTALTPAIAAEFAHLVPPGAEIPEGVEHVWLTPSGALRLISAGSTITDTRSFPRWTREPIKLPLPTEPLSVITDVVTTDGRRYPLGVMAACGWQLWGSDGLWFHSYAREIASFTAAKVVPA